MTASSSKLVKRTVSPSTGKSVLMVPLPSASTKPVTALTLKETFNGFTTSAWLAESIISMHEQSPAAAVSMAIYVFFMVVLAL